MKNTFIILLVTLSLPTLAANQEVQSFSKAKKLLEKNVYNNHRKTFYCGDTKGYLKLFYAYKFPYFRNERVNEV